LKYIEADKVIQEENERQAKQEMKDAEEAEK